MSPNPFAWSFRIQFLTGFAICAALIAYALYEQYVQYLDPCPLCIFQRVAFMFMGVWFLLGGLHAPKGWGRKVYSVLVGLGAVFGIVVAVRHLWLQSLPPDQVPACGPTLEYMLQAFPLSRTLQMVFTGSGECAEVNWRFLGLAMPGWTLILYILMGSGAVWAGWKRRS